MTKELDERERKLNKITKLDPKLKTPTKDEYRNLAKIGDSVEEYTIKPARTFRGHTRESYKSYNDIYAEIDGVDFITEDIEHKAMIMEGTKAFFGIPFHLEETLLYRISDEAYIRDEDAEAYTKEYKDWLLLCTHIDAIKPYINLSCPEFDKKQNEYKNQFKDIAQELPHVEFFRILSTFFDHYSLKQIRKAKIDTLIDTGLPNIGENEAKKIVIMLENKKKFHSN